HHQWRPDRAGRNAVHADLSRGKILGEGARKRHDRAFSCGIIQQMLAAPVGHYGGCINDGGAFLQVLEGSLRTVKKRVDIDSKCALELILANVLYALVFLVVSGIVYQ